MSTLTGDEQELKRSLNWVDATMMVAGSMIGSGIFIVSADMSRAVGSAGYLLLLWIITGLITVFAALSYGELAGMMPKAGGQFVYIQRAYGNLIAFVYGWTVFTVIQTGVIAAVAVAFAKFSGIFFPVLNENAADLGFLKISFGQLWAILSIVLLTFINSRGVSNGKLLQTAFTSTKLIALAGLIVLGIVVGMKTGYFATNFTNPFDASTTSNKDGVLTIVPLAGLALIGAMGSTIINSLFSCDAWNNVTFIAAEIKDPKRNIPRSLFLGTLLVTVLYLLANIAYLGLLPLHGLPTATDVVGRGIQFAENDRVGAAAASMIFGNTGLYIMAGLIMLSTFGCNNGLILAGARVYYAMSKENLFFKKAGSLNARHVPAFALWVQCAWACALCLTGTYKDLVNYATFASMIFYIITIAGVFILRKKEPDTERPYKAFGYPLIPALYILAAFAVCAILIIYDARNTGFGLLCVALGIPVYYLTVGKTKKVE